MQELPKEDKAQFDAMDKWFQDEHLDVYYQVKLLAWEHRKRKPIIRVQTSPGDAKTTPPRVTMVPFDEWQREHAGRTGQHVMDQLREFFSPAEYNPDVAYMIAWWGPVQLESAWFQTIEL